MNSAMIIQWIIFSLNFSLIYTHTGNDPHERHGGTEVEEFYEECGISATCLGLMSEKSKLISCRSSVCPASLVLMPPFPEEQDKTIHFHLRLNTNEYGYMAVGLTKNANSKMNEMLVLECLVDSDLNGYSFMSWNQAMPNNPTPSNPFTPPERFLGQVNPMKTDVILSTPLPGSLKRINLTLPSHEEEGVLFCTFMLPKRFWVILPTSKKLSFNLISQTYTVSISMGVVDDKDGLSCPNVKSQGQVGPTLCKHRAKGSRRFKLMEVQDPVDEESEVLGQLHALLMVFAYFNLIPTATIISRYFRETWSTKQICKRRIWFPIHFTLLYCALACIWVAYICQAVNHKSIWPDGEHSKGGPYHALIGMISMILLLSQTILPWVVGAMSSSRPTLRRLHSIFHAVVGTLCYGLGVLNILLTPIFIPEAADCGVTFVVFLWIACHFCLYWLLATLLVIKDHQMPHNNSKFRALLSYPMRLQTTEEAPGKTKRKVFLGVFVFLSLCMTSLMSYHIFMKDATCQRYLEIRNNTGDSLSTTPRSSR